MTHLTTEQMQRFRARELSPDEMAAADEHLAGCAGCRARVVRLSGTPRAVQQVRREAERAVTHLSAATMEALTNGTASANDRRIAEAHLASCAECRRELADLKAYVASLAEMRRTELASGRDRRAVAAAPPDVATTSWVTRARAWLTPPRRIAVGFAAMLLVVASLPFLARSRGPGPTTAASVIDTRGAVQGTILLRDGGLTIVQDSAGAVSGIDAYPEPYRRAIQAALDAVRQPRGTKPPVTAPGDSATLAAARAAFPNAHLLLGALAMRAGRLNDAENEYRVLLGANPTSPAARRMLEDALLR